MLFIYNSFHVNADILANHPPERSANHPPERAKAGFDTESTEFDIPKPQDFESQKKLPLKFKGRTLKHFYQPDLFCYDKIIVELKACAATADVHRAQLLNYLRITGCKLGLLINFGTYPKVSIERFVI